VSESEYRVLNRGFCIAFASSLLYFLGLGVVLPVLPLFVTQQLHGNNLTVGIVVGVFAASAVVARPLAGRLGNRLGRRVLMIGGAAVVGGSVVLYGAPGGVIALVGWRLVTGFGEGFFFTGSATLVADMAPEGRRAQVLSYFSVALYAGMGLGPVLGEAVLRHDGPTAAFAVAGALALVGALVPFALPERHQQHGASAATHFFHRRAIGPGVVLIGGIMGITAFQAYVPLYVHRIGMSGPQWVFLLYSAVVLTSRILAASLADRIGVTRIAGSATSLIAVGLLTMAGWGRPAGLYLGTVLFGLGISLQYPALMTLVVNRVPPEERSSAVGTFTMSFDLAQGASGFLFGAVAAAVGFRSTFAVGAGCALVGLTLLLSVVGRRAERAVVGGLDERAVLGDPDAWLPPGAD
jgi:MFS family permease